MNKESFLKYGLSAETRQAIIDLKARAENGDDHFDSFDCDYAWTQVNIPIDIHPFIYSYSVTCPECGCHELKKREPDWHPKIAICANPECGRIMESPVDRPCT